MSLPGKGREGHLCPTIVTPWSHHFDCIQSVMHLVVQQKLLQIIVVRGP